MNINLKQVGQFIQFCRKDQNMTQAELSERLNTTPQAVSNWERGESLPDVANLLDLANVLHCSVDAILTGGEGSISYRRHVTVAQMREALSSIERVGQLLGRDHFIYQCIIDSLNQCMNTTMEKAFTDEHIFEVFTGEFLIACINNGDYVDPRDVEANLKAEKSKAYIRNLLKEKGIR